LPFAANYDKADLVSNPKVVAGEFSCDSL